MNTIGISRLILINVFLLFLGENSNSKCCVYATESLPCIIRKPSSTVCFCLFGVVTTYQRYIVPPKLFAQQFYGFSRQGFPPFQSWWTRLCTVPRRWRAATTPARRAATSLSGRWWPPSQYSYLRHS